MPAKRLVLRALEETGRTKAPLHPLAELLPLGHPNFGMPPSTSNGRVVFDSDKMRKLDKLLFKLKRNGHRVLLYSQMTTMLDLLEVRILVPPTVLRVELEIPPANAYPTRAFLAIFLTPDFSHVSALRLHAAERPNQAERPARYGLRLPDPQ